MSDTRAIRGLRIIPWLLGVLIVLLLYQGFLHRPNWEYRVEKLGAWGGKEDKDDTESLASELRHLGDGGWELVSFETLSYDDDRRPVEARVAMRRRKRGP